MAKTNNYGDSKSLRINGRTFSCVSGASVQASLTNFMQEIENAALVTMIKRTAKRPTITGIKISTNLGDGDVSYIANIIDATVDVPVQLLLTDNTVISGFAFLTGDSDKHDQETGTSTIDLVFTGDVGIA